jgi:opacity protein-like surface antigen
MIRARHAFVGLFLLAMVAAPARADLTGFIGANTTPANRQTRGVALGVGLLIVGFEFEYASTTDDALVLAPALTTGSGNLLLQTPGAFFGFQPYVTTGGGMYQEELGTHKDTGFGLNTGGGVKVNLLGPIRLRVDYRVFKQGSGALYSTAHRVYAGLNLKF